MNNAYPKYRLEGWIPILGDLIEPGDILMSHPHDCFVYTAHPDRRNAWTKDSKHPLRIQPDQWYYIKAGA